MDRARTSLLPWRGEVYMEEIKTDVVVAGGGMAGLAAALQALELGANVVIVEKGESMGGSLAMSGGTLWCDTSHENLLQRVPKGDRELGRVLVDEFPDGIEWLRGHGRLEDVSGDTGRYIFMAEPDPATFAGDLGSKAESLGCRVITGAWASELTTDENGNVTGLIARTRDGVLKFSAQAVILATGGFHNSTDLLSRYYGRWSDRLVSRGNLHSTGDGLLMATAAGAATSRAMTSFYGHLIPAPPAEVPRDAFVAYTMYHSSEAVLVNLAGERFTDESRGDERNSQAVAREQDGIAFMVYDDHVYREHAVRLRGFGSKATDTFHNSRRLGAPAATAESIEELARQMAGWGVYEPGVVETITRFNTAIDSEDLGSLQVPRSGNLNPVSTPPFYALGVVVGVTMTLGGLKIDADARVIDRGGLPVQGLYAAGADAGGIHNEDYGGGLNVGLVFGRRAARHAVGILKGGKEPGVSS